MAGLLAADVDDLAGALSGKIFRLPSGEYELAQNYLSGNVVAKLEEARAVAKDDPAFMVNVKALEQVQPERAPLETVVTKLGANWIPADSYDEFFNDLLGRSLHPRYVDAEGTWVFWAKSLKNVRETEEYGTAQMGALEIIDRMMNAQPLIVYKDAEDDSKRRIVDNVQTAAVRMKAAAIAQAFKEWMLRDPQRANELEEVYNRTMNNYREPPRGYDGSHLTFPGMASGITMRPHAVNAVWRIMSSPNNVLLDHVVGSGKTFIMAAACMENRRIGAWKKPLIVVPKHLVGQFASEFLRLYPSANVLVQGEDDFTPKKRQVFLNRIGTGDWDAVIVSHSSFERMPLSLDRQLAFFKEIVGTLETEATEARKENNRTFIKELAKAKDRIRQIIDRLTAQWSKDPGPYFEELGVDALLVDEAQEFKNLWFFTKMSRMPGINPQTTRKAFDMFLKTDYLNEKTGGKNIVFATGTPITNSIAEMWILKRYLAPRLLEEKGLKAFDAWAATFGEPVTQVEYMPEGRGTRLHTRFSRFVNVPEMSQIYRQFADVIFPEDLPYLKVPKVDTDKAVVIQAPQSEQLKTIIDGLAERAQAIRSGQVARDEDNMLAVTGDGRRAAIDIRMYDASLPDLPDSKLHKCADNVYNIWKETSKDRLTQVIWSDMGVPEAGKRTHGIDLYSDLKRKLVAKGIPAAEIAFVHEASTDAKKQALYRKIRRGSVRVVIASTGRMGTGANIQDKLIAAHHLDAPWRPSDVEQRDGRIIRQGNNNPIVKIFRYVTAKSFDIYNWQTLERKGKWQAQFRKGAVGVRTIDDLDSFAMSAAEVMAIAADDPLLFEYVKLQSREAELASLEQYHTENQRRLVRQRNELEKSVEYLTSEVAAIEQDVAYLEKQGKIERQMTVGGKLYTKADISKAIAAQLPRVVGDNIHEAHKIGEVYGFDVMAYLEPMYLVGEWRKGPVGVLKRTGRYPLASALEGSGDADRVFHALQHLPERLEGARKRLADNQKKLGDLLPNIGTPFKQAEELAEVRKKRIEIGAQMEAIPGSSEPGTEAAPAEGRATVGEQAREQAKPKEAAGFTDEMVEASIGDNKTKRVPALTQGGLAVHAGAGEEAIGYTITHIGSGLAALREIPSQSRALRIAKRLLNYVDFTQDVKTLQANAASWKQLAEIIAKLRDNPGAKLPEPVSPPGSRIISQESYDAAKKHLGDQGTLRSGISPEDLKAFATIGAYHLENLIRAGVRGAQEVYRQWSARVRAASDAFKNATDADLRALWDSDRMRKLRAKIADAAKAQEQARFVVTPEGTAAPTEASKIERVQRAVKTLREKLDRVRAAAEQDVADLKAETKTEAQAVAAGAAQEADELKAQKRDLWQIVKANIPLSKQEAFKRRIATAQSQNQIDTLVLDVQFAADALNKPEGERIVSVADMLDLEQRARGKGARAARGEIRDAQREVQRAIIDMLPPAERGKVPTLNLLRRVMNAADAQEAVDTLHAVKDVLRRRTAYWQFADVAKQRPEHRTRFGAQLSAVHKALMGGPINDGTIALFDQLVNITPRTSEVDESGAALADTPGVFEAAALDARRVLADNRGKTLRALEPGEIDILTDALVSLNRAERMAREVELAGEKRKLKEAVDKASAEMAKAGKGKYAANYDQLGAGFRKVVGLPSAYIGQMEDPVALFELVGGGVKSVMAKVCNDVADGLSKMALVSDGVMRRLSIDLKARGVKLDRKTLIRMSHVIAKANKKNAETVSVNLPSATQGDVRFPVAKLSRTQLMTALLLSRTDTVQKMLAKEDGSLSIVFGQDTKAKPIILQTADFAALVEAAQADPATVAIADALWAEVNGQFGQTVEDFSEKQWGISKKRGNYWMIRRLLAGDAIADDYILRKLEGNKSVADISALYRRTGGQAPIIIGDAIQDFLTHVAQMSKAIGLFSPLLNAKHMFNQAEFNQAILDNFGARRLRSAQQWLKDVEGAGVVTAGDVESFLWRRMSAAYRYYLAIKPKIWVMQAMGAVNAHAHFKAKYVNKATLEAKSAIRGLHGKSMAELYDRARQISGELAYRYGHSIQAALGGRASATSMEELLLGRDMSMWRTYGLEGIMRGDMYGVFTAYLAAKYQMQDELRLGDNELDWTPEQKHDLGAMVDLAIRRGQGTSMLEMRGELARRWGRDPKGAMFLMFQNQTQSLFNMGRGAWVRYHNGDIDAKQFSKAMGLLAFNSIMVAALGTLWGLAYRGFRKRKREETVSDFLFDIARNVATYFYGGDEAVTVAKYVKQAYDAASEGRSFRPYASPRNPMGRVIESGVNLAIGLGTTAGALKSGSTYMSGPKKGEAKAPYEFWKTTEPGANFAGGWFGLPTAEPIKVGKAIYQAVRPKNEADVREEYHQLFTDLAEHGPQIANMTPAERSKYWADFEAKRDAIGEQAAKANIKIKPGVRMRIVSSLRSDYRDKLAHAGSAAEVEQLTKGLVYGLADSIDGIKASMQTRLEHGTITAEQYKFVIGVLDKME